MQHGIPHGKSITKNSGICRWAPPRTLPFYGWCMAILALSIQPVAYERNQKLIGEMTLREGQVVWDLNGMSSEDWDHAGQLAAGISGAAGGSLASAEAAQRLIIDTHLEVWTFDPKFPFVIRSGRT